MRDSGAPGQWSQQYQATEDRRRQTSATRTSIIAVGMVSLAVGVSALGLFQQLKTMPASLLESDLSLVHRTLLSQQHTVTSLLFEACVLR